MKAKAIIVLCAQVLLMKTVFGYCIGSTGVTRPSNLALPVANLGFPSANVAIANSGCGNTNSALQSLLLNSQPLLESLNSGGVFSVSSGSPITPNGISVSAENLVADGAVLVSGLYFMVPPSQFDELAKLSKTTKEEQVKGDYDIETNGESDNCAAEVTDEKENEEVLKVKEEVEETDDKL